MLKKAMIFILVLLLTISMFNLSTPVSQANASTTVSRSVAGWMPYWDQTRAFSVVQNNSDIFDEMSPFWYDLGSSGELVPLSNSENSTIISYAQNNGKKLIPLISNEFNATVLSTILNSPTLVQGHITNIVNKVVSMGYSGIEIDYENVLATDKAAYSSFIQNLAQALHAQGKILIVTVQAKSSSSATWNGPGGEDYAALGLAADGVRVMAYDYHWNTSAAGSIAPATWVDQVVAYAISVIPANKLILGVPDYGYDWVGTQGKGITYEQAISTASANGATITEDAQNGPHYTYTVNGVLHEVWFEDATSIQSLLDIVNKYNLKGIAIWRLGGEDSNIYSAIRTKFSTSSSTGTTTTSTGTTSTDSGTTSTSGSTTTTTTSGSTSTSGSTTTTVSGSTSTSTTSTGTTSTSGSTSTTSGSTSTSGSTTTTSGSTSTSGSTTTTISSMTVDFTYQSYKNSLNINATVSSTIPVAKVVFYLDGKLISSDSAAPYVAYYKAKPTKTTHTVTVEAYDTSGNKVTKTKSVLY